MPRTTPEPVCGPPPEQHAWEGERITNRLQIWEHESFPGMWIVCGKDDYLCGMGSPQDLLKLAQVILQRFPQQGNTKPDPRRGAEGKQEPAGSTEQEQEHQQVAKQGYEMTDSTQENPEQTAPNTGNHDAKALEVARAFHRTHRPTATILFGSRAKGTQDELESDIDILVVTQRKSTKNAGTTKRVQKVADKLYGRRVEVQLVYHTVSQVQKSGMHLDTPSGAALALGILAGGDPDRFKSVYDRDDPPPPQYDFTNHRANNTDSLHHLYEMLTYHTKQPPIAQWISRVDAASSEANQPTMTPERLYGLVRRCGSNAVDKAVDAIFWATGTNPGNRATLSERIATLGRIVPGEDMSTALPTEVYANWQLNPGITQEEYATAAHADITKLRDCAKALRRRTASAVRKTLKDKSKTIGQ